MKRILESLRYSSIIIAVVVILLGWIVVSRLDDYFLTALYFLYIAIILGCLTHIKYRKQNIENLELQYLMKEIKLESIILPIMIAIDIIVCMNNVLIFAFQIIIHLIILMLIIDMLSRISLVKELKYAS